MTDITGVMTQDHRHCDEYFAEAENACLDGDWTRTEQAFERFATALEEHFGLEEGMLFPRFEEATGMTSGPTAMMRMEHQDLRAQVEEMRAAIARQDADAYSGESETLLIMMQQHNMKEENILYPMCDTRISDAAETAGTLAKRLAEAGA
ncbi:MAG TPA: hemerythrin domain-containing protein [Azoarcus taiwanensis]|uniref:Hemerythrin domain-containing protein n=2 Tax=Azoarcus taiwanensis TaxID=666964 RepID=A0A972J885_9RHOO|nr:hemerythrin domain-containing protein [Azoarcus taiwanensis]NMG03159.1 hemerythrin domain-containing protein [Azoarcus taiwanensis]HRQ58224.1 hemerythrin domain-containing protein [Azoarcus taiwanensis]